MSKNMILNFNILNILITDWSFCSIEHYKSQAQNLNHLFIKPIQNKLKIYSEFEKSNFNSTFNKLLVEFSNIKKKEKLLSKENSINFNVLNFFSIGETLHSKLLGFFLKKGETHGQGDLFLRMFLEKLGFNYEEGSKWNVTIESQRIDILIWRENPHSVVIIENKSNDAKDQENQIYRYWHKSIYYKNEGNPLKYSDSQNYKIIYLVTSDGKLPADQSLKRPSDWSLELPERIPQELDPDIWFFKREISAIFEQCLYKIPIENYRLKEYIKQYIEYWQ